MVLYYSMKTAMNISVITKQRTQVGTTQYTTVSSYYTSKLALVCLHEMQNDQNAQK